MNRRTFQLATALAAAAALAACSGGSDEPAPANDETVNETVLTEELPAEENLAEPAPIVTENTVAAPIAEPALPDEEQIQDDAESVGMTARVQRGETSGNEAAPAE